jgi:hypothetical protein
MTRLTFTSFLAYFLFFSVGNLHAQSIVYVYDAAGNRVSRAYVVPLRSASTNRIMWYERSASRKAKKYFSKYGVVWNDDDNPTF